MQFSPGAVGKGHFVINILKNQIIWTVEMGWMVAHGQACWRGRAVAVVILGFCFVLNLGDCGLQVLQRLVTLLLQVTVVVLLGRQRHAVQWVMSVQPLLLFQCQALQLG